MEASEPVVLTVTRSEALVLFEWIIRFNESAETGTFEDPAEQRVLWKVEGLLEATLHEPFRRGYDELLEAARAVVRERMG